MPTRDYITSTYCTSLLTSSIQEYCFGYHDIIYVYCATYVHTHYILYVVQYVYSIVCIWNGTYTYIPTYTYKICCLLSTRISKFKLICHEMYRTTLTRFNIIFHYVNIQKCNLYSLTYICVNMIRVIPCQTHSDYDQHYRLYFCTAKIIVRNK